MRLSEEQVRRSLAALRVVEQILAADAANAAPAADSKAERTLPPELLEQLLTAPRLRPDAVERGRSRLASGDPTPDDLAGKVIGRLVCDRLR